MSNILCCPARYVANKIAILPQKFCFDFRTYKEEYKLYVKI